MKKFMLPSYVNMAETVRKKEDKCLGGFVA